MSYKYVQTILDYLYSFRKKNVIQNFDSKSIKDIIENYQKIQTRYNLNKTIYEFNDEHRQALVLLINQLKNKNKNLNDEYIQNWIQELEKEHAQIVSKLSEIEEHQKIFSSFTGNIQFAGIKDDDEKYLCEICEERKKDRSLGCGHIFCNMCINQMEDCPLCRIRIDRNNVRQVFL